MYYDGSADGRGVVVVYFEGEIMMWLLTVVVWISEMNESITFTLYCSKLISNEERQYEAWSDWVNDVFNVDLGEMVYDSKL